MPFESTVTASNPAQVLVHGPDNDDAHSTVATVPGTRLLATNTPFPLKEVMTGAAACAATFAPSARAQRLSFIAVVDLFTDVLSSALPSPAAERPGRQERD
jgi:hypothetical protein